MTVTASSVGDRLSSAFNDDRLLETECKQIASDIKEKSISLVTVVEALGPFITSKQIDMTKNSVHALTNIFSNLPKHFLCINETKMLLSFYIERLKDHYSILHSTLTGILHLLQMNNVPTDLMGKMLHEMFAHVHCQSLQRSERNTIFLILKYIIYNKSDEASEMNDEFVDGVMNCIDGERDPRNLLLIFEMIPEFLKKFPLGNKTEDMFEILACYFPVDYNPIEGDGGNITRDMLAIELSCCLYAIPQFAEYCLPLMIEKIESNLKVAKIDSLKLLRDCTFHLDAFQPFINELWVSLKETAMSSDPEIKSMAMEVITKIVQVISADSSVREKIIERVINDTKWTLSNVQLSSYWSSESILEAVAKANHDSCQQVLKFVIPLCLGQYSTKTSVEEKVIILKTMKNFITIAAQFDIDVQNIAELSWTDIPMLLIKELDSTNDDIKLEVLDCFLGHRKFVNSVHRSSLYQRLCDYVGTANDPLRKSSLILIENFAKIYPKEVSDVIIERLPINSDSNTEVLKHRLEVLSVLAKETEIGYSVLPKIINIAVLTSSPLNGVALGCLNNLCSSGADFDIHRYLYENGCIKKLVAQYAESSDDKRNLISSLCRSILRKLNTDEQQQIFNEYSSELQNHLTDENVLLFELLMVPMDAQVILSVDVSTYFDNLTSLALHGKNPNTRLASCKLIAVLIHKLPQTDFLETFIKPSRDKLVNVLKNENPLETKHAAVVLHTWLTKSMVIGGFSSLATECIIDQIDFLRHHEVGEIVAKEFKTLMDKNEETITKENGCKFMFLYKQRIFEYLLIENVFDGAERRNFLIALTTALEEVSVELLCIHTQTIVPILAESLTLTESQLLLPILKTLKALLTRRHEILITESKAIIPILLDLITHKEMKIRILAVECLNNYCDYPSMEIYSFKPDVLDKLQVATDDHKRLVRKTAVICRSRWFLYEQPFPYNGKPVS